MGFPTWLPTACGLLLLTTACATEPTAPIPAPLPEAGAWTLADDQGAFLGVDAEEHLADSLEALAFAPGVRVRAVVPHSPAAAAGLAPGDVLLALDDRELDSPAGLEVLVRRAGPGARVALDVQRGDTLVRVETTLAGQGGGAPARFEVAARLDPARSRAAWVTTPEGVRLVSRADDAPAAVLPVGALVTALDGEPLVSARELIRRLEARDPGDEVLLTTTLPDGRREEVELELFQAPTRVTELGLPVLFGWEAEADGSRAAFSLLDLWFFELFQYQRDGAERRWVLLELFGFDLIPFATGLGELQ